MEKEELQAALEEAEAALEQVRDPVFLEQMYSEGTRMPNESRKYFGLNRERHKDR